MEFNENNWGSGVKFVEERRPKRFLRAVGIILLVFFSASLGGILGGYYVKKNYESNSSGITLPNLTQQTTSALPKNSINKVAELVGPAIVGVNNNVDTLFWGKQKQGSGSGIIFDKNGYIVTNYHVIEGATDVTVTLSGGRKLPARIIGSDYETDIAVLKVNATNLPVAKFGDSSSVRVGDIAIAIGNPLGEEFAGSVTMGVISAINREITVEDRKYKVIQTDASINQGNSGGALCNENGEVIGINTLKITSAEGMGFAIPINEAKKIIEELMKHGYVSRPYIGVAGTFIDEEQAKEYGVPVGVGVQEVVRGSGADLAGIRPGDIIVEFDGKKLTKFEDLQEAKEKRKVGDIVKAKVWRDGRYFDVRIKLTEQIR
ncbi:trypsin-like peptidase domain-containing protein [Caloramator sp. CAR-1]|uniref:S1C family serine protease n=1 Tax=Caloramator sp. CAR-1 TaxID=3062777 RepID=UPI0026E29042|nr:trypsin-like peptidase domain-containing protein [Caloramator sp. CAR-1]MDO6354169.1 trypsin-like peptidase domain-containing protein [Caloramator sp. CAR-1]